MKTGTQCWFCKAHVEFEPEQKEQDWVADQDENGNWYRAFYERLIGTCPNCGVELQVEPELFRQWENWGQD